MATIPQIGDTTVCGQVEYTTAFTTCNSLGWLASTGTGTAESLG